MTVPADITPTKCIHQHAPSAEVLACTPGQQITQILRVTWLVRKDCSQVSNLHCQSRLDVHTAGWDSAYLTNWVSERKTENYLATQYNVPFTRPLQVERSVSCHRLKWKLWGFRWQQSTIQKPPILHLIFATVCRLLDDDDDDAGNSGSKLGEGGRERAVQTVIQWLQNLSLVLAHGLHSPPSYSINIVTVVKSMSLFTALDYQWTVN